MDNNIDVAKIMAEITCETEKRYAKNDKEEKMWDNNVNLSNIDSPLCAGIKSNNHLLYESLSSLHNYNGIHARIPSYGGKKTIAIFLRRFIARLVSKLTRFIMVEQNHVNMTMIKDMEILQNSVLNVADWSKEIEYKINALNDAEKELEQRINLLKDTTSSSNEERTFTEKSYLEFEQQHRGNEESIKQRLQIYIDKYVVPSISVEAIGMIVDLGCGRGEWLSLLEENGYYGIGIDLNSESLKYCELKNIKTYCMDVIEYLRTLPSESVKLLTSFQLVEHLKMGQLLELFEEIGRVMRKDGMIIMETPNPENLNVGAHTFYIDPTHKRPIPAELLKYIAEENGLNNAVVEYWQKPDIETWWKSVWEQENTPVVDSAIARVMMDTFTKHFWCSADYALIAIKGDK